MIKISDLYNFTVEKLELIYSSEESRSITNLVFENIFHFSPVDIRLNFSKIVNDREGWELENILSELSQGKPVQHILGYAWFSGMKLIVNEHVLIPRRETEELIDLVSKEIVISKKNALNILDICTGSGCIALALKKKFSFSEITGIDISPRALEIAKENSDRQNLPVHFMECDIFSDDLISLKCDYIVSNPPYILNSEKSKMDSLVLDNEPHLALFVNDDDPLIFHRRIAVLGQSILNPEGRIFFEINEMMGQKVCALLHSAGYKEIIIKKDFQEKDRFVFAQKSAY